MRVYLLRNLFIIWAYDFFFIPAPSFLLSSSFLSFLPYTFRLGVSKYAHTSYSFRTGLVTKYIFKYLS